MKGLLTIHISHNQSSSAVGFCTVVHTWLMKWPQFWRHIYHILNLYSTECYQWHNWAVATSFNSHYWCRWRLLWPWLMKKLVFLWTCRSWHRSGRFGCHSVVLSTCRITAAVISRFRWNSALYWAYTNRKNLLTFVGGDPVPDTDFGSLFYFAHHCETGDFMRFISSSLTVTGRFSRQQQQQQHLFQ